MTLALKTGRLQYYSQIPVAEFIVPRGLVLLHGKPGAGKTTLASYIALKLAASGDKVLYFDTSPAGDGVSRLYAMGLKSLPAERVQAIRVSPRLLRRLIIPAVVIREDASPAHLIVDELSSVFLTVAETSPPDDSRARSVAYREMLFIAALLKQYAVTYGMTCVAVVDDSREGPPVGGRALQSIVSGSIRVEASEGKVRRLVVESGPGAGTRAEFVLTSKGLEFL